MEEAVAAMLAREEIRELVNRYFDCMWRRDIEAALDLYTPDGEMVMANAPLDAEGRLQTVTANAPERVVKGRDALRALYAGVIPANQPLPFGHNTVVTLDSETRASGRTYAELRQSGDFSWRGVFTIADDFEKVDGAWKFARRRLWMMHVAPAS